MQIRIEADRLPGRSCAPGPDFPGAQNVHVGVQRKNDPGPGTLLGVQPGDAPSATWTLECEPATTDAGIVLRGPHIQNRSGGRFIYLSWVEIPADGATYMFRRAKLMFDAIPPDVLDAAVHSGVLIARLGLTDAKGGPLCAAVRPPLIEWTARSE